MFNFDKPSRRYNKHYFLGEELIMPMSKNTDTQRTNMFANHLNQFIHLVKPEFPRVFTNFENQVGEYSVAYKKAKEDFNIISKIEKNEFNYDLIIQYKSSKVYDILHYRRGVNITEDYGYELEDCLSNKKEGDLVYKDDYVYKSSNYDEDGNFMIGTNFKAIYLPYKNLTYEDGVVISETAAKKLAAHKVERTMFSVNSNDILLNLYGDKYYYKSFPRVGDKIEDEKVLVAIRRKNQKNVLYDFQTDKLMRIDSKDDIVKFTGGGQVVDIDLYSNIPLDQMKKIYSDEFRKEIIEVYEKQLKYYNKLAEELEKIIPVKDKTTTIVEYKDNKRKGIKEPITEEMKEENEFGISIASPIENNPNKFTDELAYYWKISHEMIDERIKWRHEGKAFDSFKMRFTILKENPLTEGAKLTGRYGNKGVVSMIIPDEEMPETEDGKKAEVILNPLGIINRLNPSQIQEQHLNFMGDRLIERLKECDDLYDMEDEYFGFMKEISPEFHEFIELEYMIKNRREKETFFDEIIEKGIYIHQPPFFGTTDIKTFAKIFVDKPYLVEEYKFKGIEKPLVMGDIYFLRLKHEASNKTSARSATLTNLKGLPSKSSLKKEKRLLVSQTPIRLGEMETTNMMLPKRSDLVEKLLKTHSTSSDSTAIIEDLLSSNNPLDLKVKLKDQRSINREILQKYFNVLGLDIED